MFAISKFAAAVTLLSKIQAIKIYGDLLELAERQGFLDTFVQFRPFDFNSPQMKNAEHFLNAKVPELTAYKGLQKFEGEAELTPFQLRRAIRRQTVMELLTRHAEQTQGPTLSRLQGQGYDVTSFWIDNSILIRRAPVYLLTMLVKTAATDGDEEILSLSPNRIVARVPPVSRSILDLGGNEGETQFTGKYQKVFQSKEWSSAIPWNLRLIKVDKVWSRTRGKGVVVANIDTGVDFLHPLLKMQYRGMSSVADGKFSHGYNWFDPEGLSPIPHDVHGHGTHTMGTMVGKEVGVASEAKWIAAQGCDTQSCSQARLLASAQWVMCPTDETGQNPRCDLGADIINNSWGGEITDEESLTWFSASVESWLAAGLIPIFAQGNSGPGCGTAGTPGDLENVMSVGAVDQLAALAIFSSRGPGGSRLGHAKFKPDFVAPGQGVTSCNPGGALVAMSGTSMAAPHIAGVAALLLSLNGELGFNEIRQIMTESANTKELREPQMGQKACFGMRWDIFPNYHYGFGLVDAQAAVILLEKGAKDQRGSI